MAYKNGLAFTFGAAAYMVGSTLASSFISYQVNKKRLNDNDRFLYFFYIINSQEATQRSIDWKDKLDTICLAREVAARQLVSKFYVVSCK